MAQLEVDGPAGVCYESPLTRYPAAPVRTSRHSHRQTSHEVGDDLTGFCSLVRHLLVSGDRADNSIDHSVRLADLFCPGTSCPTAPFHPYRLIRRPHANACP